MFTNESENNTGRPILVGTAINGLSSFTEFFLRQWHKNTELIWSLDTWYYNIRRDDCYCTFETFTFHHETR